MGNCSTASRVAVRSVKEDEGEVREEEDAMREEVRVGLAAAAESRISLRRWERRMTLRAR